MKLKTKLKKRVCFKDSSESPYGKKIRPDKSVSDDSASRKAPSKFDTNLVLYTLILPSAGPQSSRESKATSSQRRRSFRPNYSHPVEAQGSEVMGLSSQKSFSVSVVELLSFQLHFEGQGF
jgi:hypothetical protein